MLILHGMSGNRHGGRIRGTNRTLFGQVAQIFAGGGIASLRISTGGRGGSEGAFHDMTLERRVQEALRAIEWISEQRRFDPGQINILGHSQGSIIATSTAARMSGLGTIKSVVLWAPQSNALVTYRRSMGEAIYQKGLKAAPDEVVQWHGTSNTTRAFKRGFFENLANFHTLDDVEEHRGRLLVVTGKRDRWSTRSDAQGFKDRHRGETKLSEFDVGHRMGASTDLLAVTAVAQGTLDWLNAGN